MGHDVLAAILEKGNAEPCVTFFAKLSEQERQSCAVQALDWFKKVNANPTIQLNQNTWASNPLFPAARVAVLAACSLTQLKKLGRGAVPSEAFKVLAARRPDWLDDWVEWYSDQPHSWSLVRQLMNAGLCRKPRTDNYVLGMIVGLCPYHESKRTIYDALLADPELLEEDVWRLFEVEGDGDLTLAARDKYSRRENNWTHALLRLAEEKKQSRARLLDASLAALKRDFSQFHAGWFSQFHEALEPTALERAERGAHYLDLLASRIPPTVSFALKALQILEKAERIEPAALLGAMGPALWNRHKGTVKLALQLIDKTLRKHPKLCGPVGVTVAEALTHESPDVQKQIDLLERYAEHLSAETAATVRERMSGLSASQLPRLQKLLANATGGAGADTDAHQKDENHDERIAALRRRAAAVEKKWRRLSLVDALLDAFDHNHVEIKAVAADPLAIPRLVPQRRLVPIETLDDLIDLYLRVLEDPNDPMEVETVLDGVSRLCDQKPAEFALRTSPLRKRALDRLARTMTGPFVGCGVLVDLCGLARAWLCGEVVVPERKGADKFDKTLIDYTYSNTKEEVEFFAYYRPTVSTFLSMRTLGLAQRSAIAQAAPLLAAPTHGGGWIDPQALVERALLRQARQVTEDRFDQIQALLRLAPDHRGTALKSARWVDGPFGPALRYALGGHEKIGADAALWVAAARARDPGGNDDRLDKKHPDLGPDAGRAAQYRLQIKKHGRHQTLFVDVEPPSSPAPEFVTVLMNPHPRKLSEFDHMELQPSVADIRWMNTVWPSWHESWFARAAGRIADNLDWWEARWSNRTFLEPLLDPDVPPGTMALLMLALGLAAKDTGENSLATDALIAGIDDGRLDAASLGTALGSLAFTDVVKLSRWARTLSNAAKVSPLHRWVIAQAIQIALEDQSRAPGKDMHLLLELLKESLFELRDAVKNAKTRAFLQNISTAGKTGRLVRELLDLEENKDGSKVRDILLRALEGRLERAEDLSRRA